MEATAMASGSSSAVSASTSSRTSVPAPSPRPLHHCCSEYTLNLLLISCGRDEHAVNACHMMGITVELVEVILRARIRVSGRVAKPRDLLRLVWRVASNV